MSEGASRFVGIGREEAEKKAVLDGLSPRVVAIDGEGLMVTADIRMDRVNFELLNGYVVRAYYG